MTMPDTKDKNSNKQGQEVCRQGNERGEKKQGKEIGGPKGLEPTRYGDWEKKGRCIDF